MNDYSKAGAIDNNNKEKSFFKESSRHFVDFLFIGPVFLLIKLISSHIFSHFISFFIEQAESISGKAGHPIYFVDEVRGIFSEDISHFVYLLYLVQII